MSYPTDSISLDEHVVAHVFKSALQIAAQDIRITLYRPANDVSVNFRIIAPSGTTELIRYKPDATDYVAGWRLIATLIERFCTPGLQLLQSPPAHELASDLSPEWAAHFGLERARVMLKPVRDGRVIDGYVVVVNLYYPVKAASASEEAA